MSYFRSINQEVLVSDENSSVVNLSPDGTFAGTGRSTLGVNAIQINLKTDQNCTISVDQGPDATTWDITDAYNYYSSLGGNSWTVQATGAYTRTRVLNLSHTAATTFFRLQSILCPIVDALPRSLTVDGNLKTAVNAITGTFGSSALITPMNALKTAESYKLQGEIFDTPLDSNFWTYSVTGTGTATVLNSELNLSDGTAASSTARVQSLHSARYIPSYSNFFRGQIRCPTQYGDCVRRWGSFDTTNGYFFQYDGTNLSLMTRRSGVDSTIANGSFNGTLGNTYPALNTNCNTYEIYWTNKSAYFQIGGVLLHTATGNSSPLVGKPHLSLGFECNKGSIDAYANSLLVRVASISRLGKAAPAPSYRHVNSNSASLVNIKSGPGQLLRLMINSPGGPNNVLTLYDSTGVSNAFASLATGNSGAMGAFTYEIEFFDGLSYVLNGDTTAADITFIYD